MIPAAEPHEGIYTFMDCEYRYECDASQFTNPLSPTAQYVLNNASCFHQKRKYSTCGGARCAKKCPRGYA